MDGRKRPGARPSRQGGSVPSSAGCPATRAFTPVFNGLCPGMTNESWEERTMSDIHEIYAIKYGRHERRKAENYLGGDPHDAPEPIDYFVWAIVGASGTFVVD